MKKLIAFCLMIVSLFACLSLAACGDEPTYSATSDFYYSSDKGHTYGNRTKEYAVGETVYMQVVVKVTSNQEESENVNVKLTIPNITAVDAKYYDGQIITPVVDAVQNVTTYDFVVVASSTSDEWSFFFQFIPNAEAEVKMTLVFDDKLDSLYDKQNTIKFVAAEENPDENPDNSTDNT